MSDRLNHELLSAYLDNEVTSEERIEVEKALAESAEVRTSLESLRQVQARLQAIPRRTLPADFHERVLREVDRRTPDPTVSVPSSGTRRWMGVAAIATTVAALVLVAVMVVSNRPDSNIVENSNPDGTGNVVQHSPLPDDNVLVAATPRPIPTYVLVLDLAITKQGQQEDVFGQVLKRAGILFDPGNEGVVLDNKLRDGLLNTRFVAGAGQLGADQANEQFDVIDMVYVHGTGAQVDDIHRQMVGAPEVRVVLDVAFKPDAAQVLNSIGERSWSLASAESSNVPGSYAYRLNIGLTLHSTRNGFFAKFPTPGLDVRLLENNKSGGPTTGLNVPLPFDFGGGQPKRDGAIGDALNANADPDTTDPIYEILVIRRNLQAGFPEDAPQ